MSWSISKKSADKDELKSVMLEQQYMPESVKRSIFMLIDSFADGHVLDVASYGHHSNEQIANVSITINDAGPLQPE